MSADNTQETSQTSGNPPQDKGLNLKELSAQLAELAENQKTTMEALGTLARSQRQPEPRKERNFYEPTEMLEEVEERVERKIQAEAAKNLKIAELSKEYPELNSDAKMIQAVVKELEAVPAAIRNSPEGYEMAILKTVHKQGLTPKSKRRDNSIDEDISLGNSGRRQPPPKRVKVSEETLAAAELMGLDVSDPKVVERLENHANRNFDRYK